MSQDKKVDLIVTPTNNFPSGGGSIDAYQELMFFADKNKEKDSDRMVCAYHKSDEPKDK